MWQANMRGRSGLGGTTGRTASCTTFVLDLRSAVCYYRVIGTEEHDMTAQDLDTIAVFVMIAGTISVVGLIVVVELGFAALAAWDWWRG